MTTSENLWTFRKKEMTLFKNLWTLRKKEMTHLKTYGPFPT